MLKSNSILKHITAFRTEIPKKLRFALGILSFLLFIALWSFLTYSGLIKPLFLPSPTDVIKSSIELFQKYNLWGDISASVFRVTMGFAISSLLAIPIGILMGSFKSVDAFLGPITAFIRYMPVTAFIPLLILWLGIGHSQKIALLFIGVFFYLLSFIVNVVIGVREDLIETAYTLGATKFQIIRKVTIPASMPGIFDCMRTMMGGAWTLIVAAELVASESGVGKMIIDSQRFLQTSRVITGIVVIGTIGVISDQIFRITKPLFFPWLKSQS